MLRKFRFTPLEPGKGEIWIVAWQRRQPLVTLRLKFKIVAPGTAGGKRMVRAEAGAAEVPAGVKPVDRLTIIELQVGNRLAYRYELDSPSLGRNWVFVSDQFQRDRAEFIDGIYRKIEASIVEQTANLLGAEQNRPLIVLNACRAGRTGWQLTKLGGFAKAFLARGAGLFIGALWSVGDAPARNFTEAFYAGLLLGKPVAEAAVNARETARKAKDATWLAYTVYGHPHATLAGK